ncbi:hypothetical protein L798_01080 [Zootermopsis nevadensis]|uniref:Uncharacterized protein n=1 Tax=Zootermopsis nevadensis TaxID=136037 RepID=A0A067RRH8_ZOONE|nr:hypothetical protein L798_01080 [Zootermopsis nevadensis]
MPGLQDMEEECKILNRHGINELLDQPYYRDKEYERKNIKQPVCTQAQGYMQDTRPELAAAPTDAHTACKGTRGERRERISPPATPKHTDLNRWLVFLYTVL